MTDHEIQLWMLVATVVVAIGTLAAAVSAAVAANITAKAANSWRDGLRQQRADECVTAMEDCSIAIGRSISRKRDGVPSSSPGGLGVNDAWHSWAKFKTTIAVFGIYKGSRFEDVKDEGEVIMKRLNEFANTTSYNASIGDGINSDFGKLKAKMSTYLH